MPTTTRSMRRACDGCDVVLIDSDAELVDQLWNSNDPANVARLEAQARLIAAYEEMKWRRPPSVARFDPPPDGFITFLGTSSRVSEVMSGKNGRSTAMVQRLRFRVPAIWLRQAAQGRRDDCW